MRNLALVIPELLPVTPEIENDAFPVPATPGLARLLACGSVSVDPSTSGRERLLLKLFGIESPVHASLPLAAIMRVADGGKPDSSWWLRLDAVNLQADIDKLVLQPPGALPLAAEANHAFGALLRQVLACEDADLEPAAGGGWYLRLACDPEITTVPPVAGRTMAPLEVLPAGKDAARWHQAITEIQMLLFQLHERYDADSHVLRNVSSVWVWGAGRYPEQILPPARVVFGEGTLLQGLGWLGGVEVAALPASSEALLQAASAVESGLAVIEAPAEAIAVNDPWAWQLWLQELEARWFEPLWRALGRGQVRELSIRPGMGAEFRTSRRALGRFWRRRRAVTDWAQRLGAYH